MPSKENFLEVSRLGTVRFMKTKEKEITYQKIYNDFHRNNEVKVCLFIQSNSMNKT